MGNLEVRFHGICTHFYDLNEARALHRVVLLRCDDLHRPLLSVPPDVTIEKTGDPACTCIEEVTIDDPSDDLHFKLDGVHLSIPGAQGGLHWDDLWDCGVPKLTRLYPGLGAASTAKVKQEPPVDVAVWVDVTAGALAPYVSLKGAVAVRLQIGFGEEPARIVARCWECPDVTWTFTFPGERPVRVSNDCGAEGDPNDFITHYRIAEIPPTDAPTLDHLPDCLPKPPEWADWPPGGHNASLGCSNSGYP